MTTLRIESVGETFVASVDGSHYGSTEAVTVTHTEDDGVTVTQSLRVRLPQFTRVATDDTVLIEPRAAAALATCLLASAAQTTGLMIDDVLEMGLDDTMKVEEDENGNA